MASSFLQAGRCGAPLPQSGRFISQLRTPWQRTLCSVSLLPVKHQARPTQLVTSKSSQIYRPRIQALARFTISASSIATTTSEPTVKVLPAYKPPTTGLISYLPAKAIPYAELMRLQAPAGTYYLFFPCLFSTLLAGAMAIPVVAPSAVIGTTALFLTGALIMRGAGCTINDLWDRNLDPHVERTRLRPLARRAVTPQQAIVFLGGQLFTGLAVLLSLPLECFWYATPSLVLVTLYPLAKRVTYYPQFILGLTFSWGAMMGFPALGIDLLANQAALTAAAFLYASNVAWTVLYDMIYAHMDIKDDVKAGIKSIALKHENETKAVLSGLAVVQIGLLAASGYAAGLGPLFYIGSCGGAALTLGTMIRRVKLKEVKNCWWWFVNGAFFTGGAISLGLAGEYVARYLGWYDEEEKVKRQELVAWS
ncbi:4-hydroxybenzoate polyprenyl transferase [Didymella exigua CBS 183.55]|uniref:4-hydroxybenzoate polyprenyltransferase, mitochondrial n=1 Tax=Didymella exigua CBS 183.55 TaxID=1150837 RepID=A0A6A5RCU9_9PLEO|nr:4-hydroxybenzoate polyprenyl transferase [Didymella exigua CBS 183.55]KAF1926061.1 4-hydroxybenzoate polyprenyl transferase [Didymella exigua CBS 183.55]